MKRYKLIPKGFCNCGCGQKTNIATRNHKKCKFIKGEPIKYILGHNQKGSKHHKWNGGRTKENSYDFQLEVLKQRLGK